MAVLSVVLTVLFVVSALLMALVVLIQDDQGEGIGSMFGGGSTNTFGSRSGNILTKATTVLAAVFFLSALGVARINTSPDVDDVEARARVRRLEETQGDWFAPTRPEGTEGSGSLRGGLQPADPGQAEEEDAGNEDGASQPESSGP